jgi:hypothetical protein
MVTPTSSESLVKLIFRLASITSTFTMIAITELLIRLPWETFTIILIRDATDHFSNDFILSAPVLFGALLSGRNTIRLLAG